MAPLLDQPIEEARVDRAVEYLGVRAARSVEQARGVGRRRVTRQPQGEASRRGDHVGAEFDRPREREDQAEAVSLGRVARRRVEDRQASLDDRVPHGVVDAPRPVDVDRDDVRAEEVCRASSSPELAAVRDALVDLAGELMGGERLVEPALGEQRGVGALVLVDQVGVDRDFQPLLKDGHREPPGRLLVLTLDGGRWQKGAGAKYQGSISEAECRGMAARYIR